MVRQQVRKSLIFISFLLFPVTIYYLSPYLVFMGGAEGVITGSAIVFAAMLILALSVGRLFCAWLCPAGGMQDSCLAITNRPVKKGDWVKWLVWLPWLTGLIAVYLTQTQGLKINFFYQTQYGISVHRPEAYIVFYGVTFIIVVMALLIGRRSFCHHLCWMAPFMMIGRKISLWLHLPRLKLISQAQTCTNCMTCSKQCPMSLDVNAMVHQPSMEHQECILCGTCIDHCPSQTIHYHLGRKP